MNFQFLQTNPVNFPGLGLHFNINPVAFSLFGKEIYWYGIIIAVGMLLAIWYATREAGRVDLPEDTVADLVLFCAPVAIIFARLFYVAFQWENYAENPWKILYIWEGGLAVYGGVIGAFLTAYVYAKIKKLNFWDIADIGAVGFLIGQCIGRWGNFVNVEAYGGVTGLPWRMEIIPYEAEFGGKLTGVHPTFLYESLWNLVGFVLLFSLRKRKPFKGFLFWGYLLWYGLGRVWIEGLRTDSLMLGNLRISQLIAGICIILSIFVIIFKWKSADRQEGEEIEETAARPGENELTAEETDKPESDDGEA